MKTKLLILLLLNIPFLCLFSQTCEDYCRYVNPFIGTGEHGHTFPGPCLPNGLVQLSPDTDTEGWDWVSGYRYSDTTLIGFSHTHLSGTGCGDLGDLLIMPRVGNVVTELGTKEKPFPSIRSGISFHSQKATPGYYSVFLKDYGITAELTTTERCGYHRYTFPESDSSQIAIFPGVGIPLNLDNTGWTNLKVVNDTLIEGYRTSFGWVPHQSVYFVIQFSKPFKKYQTSFWGTPKWDNKETEGWWRNGKSVFGSVLFQTQKSEQIHVKVGISAVSIKNAYENLKAEIPDWGFEKVQKQAENKWNAIFSKIEVDGPEKLKEIFYTSLYHAFIHPNNIADINGEFPETENQIDKVENKKYFSTFSLWDTYRAAHPLYTILTPDLATEMVKSMILSHEKVGHLPIWSLWNQETYCMIGNHAIPVIADAVSKSLLDQQWLERAYKAVVQTSTINHQSSNWDILNKFGFIPYDAGISQSVSKTLEFSFDDACVAQMANKIGKTDDYEFFNKRSLNYKKLFDTQIGFFRGKNMEGTWATNFNPLDATISQGFTEANAWHYVWSVQHNIPDLINLIGGKKSFEKKLDTLFSEKLKLEGHVLDITGLIGMYAHGNEPCHHVAYLYNYSGNYAKTQMYVRKILLDLYNNTTGGLPGNDDCGQMSAWFVFSSLGFYPVNPASGIYDVGLPLFKNIKINLPNGNVFNIVSNVRENKYAKSVWLNGKKLNSLKFSHQDLISGGELRFEEN